MAKFLPLRLGFIKIGFAVAVHWFCLGACVCRGFCCPVALMSLFCGLDSAIDHRELALQCHCGVSERRRSRGFIGNGLDLKKKIVPLPNKYRELTLPHANAMSAIQGQTFYLGTYHHPIHHISSYLWMQATRATKAQSTKAKTKAVVALSLR